MHRRMGHETNSLAEASKETSVINYNTFDDIYSNRLYIINVYKDSWHICA